MANREKKQCYVVEIPFKLEKWQEDTLDRRFEAARKLYNAFANMKYGLYRTFVNSKSYKNDSESIRKIAQKYEEDYLKSHDVSKDTANKAVKKLVNNDPEVLKIYEKRNTFYRENGFSEFEFISYFIEKSKQFNNIFPSTVVSLSFARPLWACFEKLIYGNGNMLHFKKYGEFNSLASDNKSGIRLLFDESRNNYYVYISNRNAKVKVKPIKLYLNKKAVKEYERHALKNGKIKIVRIVKKFEGSKNHYYCQLTLEGIPYMKVDKNGAPKHLLGHGKVGLFIGDGYLTAISKTKTVKIPLKKNDISEEIDLITKEMERLRRLNNPNNYNEDGTVKKGIILEDGKRHRLYWHDSNKYLALKNKKRNLERKNTKTNTIKQYEIVNVLLSLGDEFYIKYTNRQTKKPVFDEENRKSNDEYRREKEYRKNVSSIAARMLIDKLNQKLAQYNLAGVHEFKLPDDKKYYCHEDDKCGSDKYVDGFVMLDDCSIPQNEYFAFIGLFFDDDKKKYDREEINSHIKEYDFYLKRIA